MNHHLTPESITKKLYPLLSAKGVKKAILFGSFAWGTQTKKSDIDLLIVIQTNKRFFDRYDDFPEINDLLENYRVELLIYTPEELEKISHRKFIKTILSEGRLIYEQ